MTKFMLITTASLLLSGCGGGGGGGNAVNLISNNGFNSVASKIQDSISAVTSAATAVTPVE